MAVMSTVERWACCNPVWRRFTGRAVIPWVLAGQVLAGDVLELGTGAGANATALLQRFPTVRLTATDVDPAMLSAARARLATFGDRAGVQAADAATLEFPDASFDAVVSLLRLHHVGNWRVALGEAFRVLRPGGRLLGYDLTRAIVSARRHGHHDQARSPATVEELEDGLNGTGFSDCRVTTTLGGLVARFSGGKG
jgi:ubiquinone/menaquinone biosynthesis C-methylase UbiE